jgi:RHS repeat-associated protein
MPSGPFGNRTGEGWTYTGSGSGPGMPTSSSASYTAPTNQTGSLVYDAAGNVIADSLNQYAYDAEGRLCAVKTAGPSYTGYIYDAAGTRVAKGQINSLSCNFATNGFFTTAGLMQSGSSYVLGPGGEQVTEYDGSGNWKHTNVFASGQLLATYAAPNPTAPSTYFALNDWLGTKRVEVGAEMCASGYSSLPYGDGMNTVSVPGYSQCPVDATEHHFTGKERDTESGNDYFEARYYSSAMGSFMSPDWSAKEEPVPYAKLDNPQTLNLYAYVGNNPLIRVDSDGHAFGLDDAIGAAAGALIGVAIEVGKDTFTGDKITLGKLAGSAVGGAIDGEAVVNAPETLGGSLALGATSGFASNGVQQLVDNATGEQKGFSGADLAASTVTGAATAGAARMVPGLKVDGVSAGRGNMKAVAQGVRTKIANGTASGMSLKTAAKGVLGGQTGDAGKTATAGTVSGALGTAWSALKGMFVLPPPTPKAPGVPN